MSEMVERVARAICVAAGRAPEGTWPRNTWTAYVGHANAAIEAMCEPTEAMLKAGGKEIDDYFAGGGTSAATPEDIYATMIDAALRGV